jgi:hypothetical protein
VASCALNPCALCLPCTTHPPPSPHPPGLLLARAHSCGRPQLPPATQAAALAALQTQLSHHTGSSSAASEQPVGSSSSSSGRSLVLAGAAAAALGYCGLVGVALPGLEASTQPAAAAAAAAADSAPAAAANGNADGEAKPPPLLQQMLQLAGCKDSRAVVRAVTAVGYIGAGSSSTQLKLAAGKGGSQERAGVALQCRLSFLWHDVFTSGCAHKSNVELRWLGVWLHPTAASTAHSVRQELW